MFKIFAGLALLASVALPGGAYAHSAIFDCFDNGDGTISCQGGYSDGSSASGVSIKVKDAKRRLIEELKLDSNSEVSFKKPAGDYKVMFDGGEGHSIEVDGKKIVQ